MKRLKSLIIGILIGVAYAFLTMLIVQNSHRTVSIGYIFALPLIMGAIPVLLSTKEQLRSYLIYLVAPWISVLTFFYLSFLSSFEGLICLVIIIGPFLVLGSLGAFLYRLYRLKAEGDYSGKLYISLLIPFFILFIEGLTTPEDHFRTVATSIIIDADRQTVWKNIKNVKNIKENEIIPHFIHIIGIPKPINGELNFEGPGATRFITWEKDLKFKEIITDWKEQEGFKYNIVVNPEDIPPTTLDEHVLIGGQYFDVVNGSYHIDELTDGKHEVTLTSTYRITTTINFYGKFWADYIFDDFHEMILEVIKNRCEIEQ